MKLSQGVGWDVCGVQCGTRQTTQWQLEKLLCSAMAAQCDTLSGYLQQSDQGSNSERSTDSPLPGSEEDLSGSHPLPDPEWTEERFRVDRKKLEVMLLGKKWPKYKSSEIFKYCH